MNPFSNEIATRNFCHAVQGPPQTVVFNCHGIGLANRLRALIGYWALSRLWGAKFCVCWVADQWCNACYLNLFEEPSFRLIEFDEMNHLLACGGAISYDAADWFPEIWRKHASTTISQKLYFNEVLECARNLNPKKWISNTVEDFSNAYALTERIGVHVRHSDNIAMYARWTKESPSFDQSKISKLEGFFSEMDKTLDGRFFLATDSPAIEKTLQNRYGRSLVIFPKHYYSATSTRPSSIEHALVEMRLLGKCKKIVGTYYSSFSKFSAFWSGTEYVDIHGSFGMLRWCSRNPIP